MNPLNHPSVRSRSTSGSSRRPSSAAPAAGTAAVRPTVTLHVPSSSATGQNAGNGDVKADNGGKDKSSTSTSDAMQHSPTPNPNGGERKTFGFTFTPSGKAGAGTSESRRSSVSERSGVGGADVDVGEAGEELEAEAEAEAAAAAVMEHYMSSAMPIKNKRKLRKNNREKQRRSELNDKFDELSDALRLNTGSGKVEKLTVLSEALSQLQALRKENFELRGEKAELKAELMRLSTAIATHSQHGSSGDGGAVTGSALMGKLIPTLTTLSPRSGAGAFQFAPTAATIPAQPFFAPSPYTAAHATATAAPATATPATAYPVTAAALPANAFTHSHLPTTHGSLTSPAHAAAIGGSQAFNMFNSFAPPVPVSVPAHHPSHAHHARRSSAFGSAGSAFGFPNPTAQPVLPAQPPLTAIPLKMEGSNAPAMATAATNATNAPGSNVHMRQSSFDFRATSASTPTHTSGATFFPSTQPLIGGGPVGHMRTHSNSFIFSTSTAPNSASRRSSGLGSNQGSARNSFNFGTPPVPSGLQLQDGAGPMSMLENIGEAPNQSQTSSGGVGVGGGGNGELFLNAMDDEASPFTFQ